MINPVGNTTTIVVVASLKMSIEILHRLTGTPNTGFMALAPNKGIESTKIAVGLYDFLLSQYQSANPNEDFQSAHPGNTDYWVADLSFGLYNEEEWNSCYECFVVPPHWNELLAPYEKGTPERAIAVLSMYLLEWAEDTEVGPLQQVKLFNPYEPNIVAMASDKVFYESLQSVVEVA